MWNQLSVVVLIFSQINLSTPVRDNRYLTKNATDTLDSLLATNRYDKRIRPGLGGPPIQISVNVLIRSMGPVSDDEQSYGLDCYFRQQWYDTRLRFQKLPGLEEFSLSWLFLEKVWKPDTYFVNGKKSYLHRITAPNKFLRLRHDGFITYSMRLTIKASCPMYLRKFPLDAQRCPLIVGSYGYTSKDVVYKWMDYKPVSLEPELQISSFDLVKVTVDNQTLFDRGELHYSIIQANFWLKRHTGYFMLQVYVPCGLIVLCSWVSFWIDPDDVAARVALGVTTVLSMTNMGFGGRAQLPKVSYWTALDWFVIICFTSVFSSMVEYAVVNFTDKVIKELKKEIENKNKKNVEIKPDETNPKHEAKVLENSKSEIKSRARSASVAVTSLGVEQEHRRVSIAGDLTASLRQSQKFGSRLSIMDLSQKLTTKVKSLINVGEIQQKLTKSIHDLTKNNENGKTVVPTVVVSEDVDDLQTPLDADVFFNENGCQDELVLEVEDEDEWDGVDGVEKDVFILEVFKKLKRANNIFKRIRFIPDEEDVLMLINSTEPPDKFSKIDIDSRRNFPLTFCLSILVYLITFTYYLTDDMPERQFTSLLQKQ